MSVNIVNGQDNLIVDRDLNIINISSLKFICDQLPQEFVPNMKEQADVISKVIGKKIHEIIEEEVISPFKDEVHKINLEYHINEANKAIYQAQREGIQRPQSRNETEALKRMESLNDWTAGVQDIPKEEEELSKIWQGWFINFNVGNDIDDLNLVMKYMKGLTSDEAMLLLYLNNPEKYKTTIQGRLAADSHQSYQQWNILQNKTNYLHEQLLEKKLIALRKGNKSLLYLTIAISISVLIFLFIFLQSKSGIESKDDPIKLIFILLSAIGSLWLIYLLWVSRNKYERTWIGEAIVGYAKQVE